MTKPCDKAFRLLPKWGEEMSHEFLQHTQCTRFLISVQRRAKADFRSLPLLARGCGSNLGTEEKPGCLPVNRCLSRVRNSFSPRSCICRWPGRQYESGNS